MQPLIVRLPNWIGDVVMSLPALRLLQEHGYALQLVGKSWAPALLAGHPWPVAVYPKRYRERVRLLRALAAQAHATKTNAAPHCNALVFPNSLSSALELRAAGLRAFGYRADARRWLLQQSIVVPDTMHQLLTYWHLASAFLNVQTQPPANIALQVGGDARARVLELNKRHGLENGYVVLCPFATGSLRGESKRWPWFADLAKLVKPLLGLPVVVCPGPGEEEIEARDHFNGAVVLDGLPLSDYAALLQQATLVIANDTGPGHIAAAVGAPLISVLGPTDPARYGPWGTNVTILKEAQGWCGVERVIETARALVQR